eukprot:scaffold57297_cov76-Phaeocystis_antarctica.AAC.1
MTRVNSTILLSSSPAHLAVPLIPRHAGGVETAVEAATGGAGAGAGAPTAAEELAGAPCGASHPEACWRRGGGGGGGDWGRGRGRADGG